MCIPQISLDILTCEVVPVHVPVHVPVGGAEVDTSSQVVGAVIQAVDVAVLGGVHPHSGPSQGIVKPVKLQLSLIVLTAGGQNTNLALARSSGAQAGQRPPRPPPSPG